jgi:hypothetical protein
MIHPAAAELQGEFTARLSRVVGEAYIPHFMYLSSLSLKVYWASEPETGEGVN